MILTDLRQAQGERMRARRPRSKYVPTKLTQAQGLEVVCPAPNGSLTMWYCLGRVVQDLLQAPAQFLFVEKPLYLIPYGDHSCIARLRHQSELLLQQGVPRFVSILTSLCVDAEVTPALPINYPSITYSFRISYGKGRHYILLISAVAIRSITRQLRQAPVIDRLSHYLVSLVGPSFGFHSG